MLVALVASAAILAVWVGYPLIIAALAALRRDPEIGTDDRPTVTVVIATRDDPAVVRQRAADVLAGDYPADRLDVVVGLDGGGAAPDFGRFGDLDARVRLVAGDAPGGKAATLNAAVRAAAGEVLVFTDAGQRFDRSAIRHLVLGLRRTRTAAVSGRLEIPAGEGGPSLSERYWRYERWVRRSEARVHSPVGVTGAVYAMRRDRWTPLPSGLILDDLWVPMRLVLDGYRVGFADAARASDTRRFDAQQEFRRKARTLTGVVQLCAWMPRVLLPWRNPIWVQFVAHKLLRLLTPYLLAAAAAGALVELVLRLQAAPGLAAALAGGAGAVALVIAARPALRRRVRGAAEQLFALQLAVVVATFNGARGRWDVWHR